ncbi:MAG: tetratricopeptide repeat protein [Alphaproteobacteria bacterium]|nr:tetratricopeptide repeat protein [Alphaproteobacteria bacterium]
MKNSLIKVLTIYSIFLGNSQSLLASNQSLNGSEKHVIDSVLKKYSAEEDWSDEEITLQGTKKFVKPVKIGDEVEGEEGEHQEKASSPDDPIKSDVAGIDMTMEDDHHLANAADLLSKAYETFQMGHYEVALMFYTKALKLEPKNEEILFGVAVTHHKLGHMDIAKNYYTKILDINPSNKFALNNFLNVLSYEKPDVALTTLRRLEAAEPSLSIIPAQIAVIYERQKDFKNAVRYFKKANKLEPSNLDYVYNIALIMEKTGQNNSAMSLYSRIIQALDAGYKANVSYKEVRTRVNNLSTGQVK